MTTPPAISDAEWEVMNVLWDAGPQSLSAAEVVDRIAASNNWSPRTVKTLLNRLIKKGALTFTRDGKSYLYRPAVRREQCVRAVSRSFLWRVFGGNVAPMLAHFVTHAELSAEEVDQLQRLLHEKRAPADAAAAAAAADKPHRPTH
ncbi:MAG TPA: BlaI/MecI/CopY family transcriptional regulator [Tepidisphaeraceae bacterium]|nr:BlaI/MecI/CopY family transcriptional regulator [Tepidisphaeraceae bacterium]